MRGVPIKELVRRTGLSRNTVRAALRSSELRREAGEEAPPADLTKAQASERIGALQQQTGRGAWRASLRRREAPNGHAEHHETQTTITLASKSAGRCQPNPQKLIRTRLSRR